MPQTCWRELLAAHPWKAGPMSALPEQPHEAERLPITEQVSHFAMNHAHAMAKARTPFRPTSRWRGRKV